MKKTLQTLLILALILAVLVSAIAATSTISTLSGYDALVSAAGGIALPDAPQGATDVQYSVIQGTHPIAQIRYKLDGISYHFRACACADAASAGDISGLKAVFSANGLQQVTAAGGQSYQMGAAGKSTLAEWYSDTKKCEYSLLSDASDAESFKTFVETVQQSAETVQSVQEKGANLTGTVKKVNKKSISLTDDKGASYRFVISSRTVNLDSKKVKKNAVVRVNYDGTYADGCEALSITLVSGSDKATKKPTKTPKPTATPKPDKKFKANGVVTMNAGNMFELTTNKGDQLVFLIEDATVKGAENAEIGNKVSVVYNIKDNRTHLISVTFSYVAPTPTPAPPTRTVSGVIQSIDTQSLSVLDGNGVLTWDFDIATAKIKGDLDADVGDNAKVSYFEDEDGNLIATVVVLSRDEPDPIDDPVIPDDDPDTGDELMTE